jgi:hypothetical protein
MVIDMSCGSVGGTVERSGVILLYMTSGFILSKHFVDMARS